MKAKTKLGFIFLMLVLLTGCSNYRIEKLSYDKITDLILYDKSPKPNTSLKGFKFYLPRDMKIGTTTDNNAIIYSSGNKLYLYVDIVSYYNKVNNNYDLELEGDRIYTNIIEHQEKEGYIIITKQDDNYFLEVMYNYAKIETIACKDDLKAIYSKALIILSSIVYNEKVINSLIGDSSLNYNEETYNLISPNRSKSDFLDVVDEYEDVDNELPDEDVIEAEE